jgi:ABC-type oligopeptide transport system substrate-binding subunit
MKKLSKTVICFAFLFFSVFAFAQQQGNHEYRINGRVVEAKEFDAFRSALKEDTGTWFCAETTNGGITGYDAVDAKGVVYVCRFVSEDGLTKASITKKNIALP